MPHATKTSNPWMHHEDGTHSAEMSELKANNGVVHRNVLRPSGWAHIGLIVLATGEEVAWSSWVAHHDPEGDVTHWTYGNHTIWND